MNFSSQLIDVMEGQLNMVCVVVAVCERTVFSFNILNLYLLLCTRRRDTVGFNVGNSATF